MKKILLFSWMLLSVLGLMGQNYTTEVKLEVPLRNSPEPEYKTFDITFPKGEKVELLDYKNDFWYVTNGEYFGWLPTIALYRIAAMRDDMQKFKTKRLTEKYGDETAKKILAGGAWIGMTREMLEESKGLPEKTNTITVVGDKLYQLIYGRQYIYLKDGKVSDIQNW